MLKMLFTFVSKFQYESLFCELTPVAKLRREFAALNHIGTFCTEYVVETFYDTISFHVFKNDIAMTTYVVGTLI